MKKELIARFLVIVLILVAIAIPIGGRMLTTHAKAQTLELHARMPENGGWSMETIQVAVGQPLHLRMTSDDVVHGFAIGQSNQPAVEIMPGEYVETTLTFDHPGKYTFYCTRWCGANHWRMRGTIEVTGNSSPLPSDPTPLYIKLGIDLDAPHPAKVVPSSPPSAARGAEFANLLPAYATTRDTYMSTSPADLWLKLRTDQTLSNLSDADLWNVIRWIWEQQTPPESIGLGIKLFVQFAAAAHGETGAGDGVIVKGRPVMTPENMGHELVRPPNFTDPHTLLGASPALLQGKIIRGGMGTGMPSWGAIFTTAQIDSVVGYLYTIAWDSAGKNSDASNSDQGMVHP